MQFPRFTLRTVLLLTTACAVLFLFAGLGYRGQDWAWGVTIGALSLGLAALLHAAFFGVVSTFAALSSPKRSNAASDHRPAQPTEAAP